MARETAALVVGHSSSFVVNLSGEAPTQPVVRGAYRWDEQYDEVAPTRYL